MDSKIHDFRPGVLNKRQIQVLIDEGVVQSTEDPGFSSLDLHLSSDYWKMKGGIRGTEKQSYFDVLSKRKYCNTQETAKPNEKIRLDANETYVFKLQENVHLDTKSNIYAYATGKSSVGRLDILTRLIFEYSSSYDIIEPSNKEGSLFLEITPITFPIEVSPGTKMSQLRFFRGPTELSQLTEAELPYYSNVLILDDNTPLGNTSKTAELRLDLTENSIGGQSTSVLVRNSSGIFWIDFVLVFSPDNLLIILTID